MAQHKRFHLNADGPFYVVDGCCVACEVPFTEAPELLAMHESDKPGDFRYHCYFKRQPQNEAEIEHAIQAMSVQDLGCLRYSGEDAGLLRRLRDLGLSDHCDAIGTHNGGQPKSPLISPNKGRGYRFWVSLGAAIPYLLVKAIDISSFESWGRLFVYCLVSPTMPLVWLWLFASMVAEVRWRSLTSQTSFPSFTLAGAVMLLAFYLPDMILRLLSANHELDARSAFVGGLGWMAVVLGVFQLTGLSTLHKPESRSNV